MTVHDKTRLIGRLRRFHRLAGDESPKVLQRKTLGPGPLPSNSLRLSARPLY